MSAAHLIFLGTSLVTACCLIPGVQEAVVICLNKQTREAADQSLCVSSRRPPQLLQDCKTQPCPPRYGKTHKSDWHHYHLDFV